MQILEVMRKLNHESEVAFLLSAYTETLQHFDNGSCLPRGVATLPLGGVEDVRDRFEALLDVELNGGAGRSGVPAPAFLREAVEVFGVALGRMLTLAATKHGVATASRPDTVLEF